MIGDTIRSVLAQTFREWELVVYDDGSTDETPRVAEDAAAGDPRVKVVRGSNGGVAAARNAGFACTDPGSEYVVFLDNDDLWDEQMLATLVDALDANPEHVAAHCTATCIDEHGVQPPDDDIVMYMRHRFGFRDGRLVEVGPADGPTTFCEFAHSNWIVTPGTMIIRREIAAELGGFDARVVPADDWDVASRISRHGPVGYVDAPLLRWRRHAGAQSLQSNAYRLAHLRVRHKMLVDATNTPTLTVAARCGYRSMVTTSWGLAADAARSRSVKDSARAVARAFLQSLWYVRSEVVRGFARFRPGR